MLSDNDALDLGGAVAIVGTGPSQIVALDGGALAVTTKAQGLVDLVDVSLGENSSRSRSS